MSSLPDPNVTLREARDFVFSSRLGRLALDVNTWPRWPNVLHDVIEIVHQLVQSCHMPEFTDHGLLHLCSLVDRLSWWECPGGSWMIEQLSSEHAGILLLATLIMTENEGNRSTEGTVLTSKVGLSAVSIANSFVEKVTSTSLYFDEFTRTHSVQPRPTSPSDSASLLAGLSATLGPDAGETSPATYDDVDDFNGYNDTVGVDGVGTFHVQCRVRYYDPAGDTVTSSKTWYKLFTVAVTDTVPGTDTHYLQVDGQQVAIQRTVVLSYFNFM